MALVLLAGAGSAAPELRAAVWSEPGFNPEHLLTLQVWLPVPNDAGEGPLLHAAAAARVLRPRAWTPWRGVPGVAGRWRSSSRLPYRGSNDIPFDIDGAPVAARPAAARRPKSATVTPELLRDDADPARARTHALGGRRLDRARRGGVNRTMAAKYWPDDGSGRPSSSRLFNPKGPLATIVGVAGDVRQVAPDLPPREEIYVSSPALPRAADGVRRPHGRRSRRAGRRRDARHPAASTPSSRSSV